MTNKKGRGKLRSTPPRHTVISKSQRPCMPQYSCCCCWRDTGGRQRIHVRINQLARRHTIQWIERNETHGGGVVPISSLAGNLYQKGDDIALNGKPISELRSVTCHKGSHSHPTQVNVPCFNPSQISWYSIYLPRRDVRLS